MNATPSSTSVADSSIDAWRIAAENAPVIGFHVRLRQLAWTVLIGVGVVPTLAIIKYSFIGSYWPGLLNTGVHMSAICLAYLGVSRESWTRAPWRDLLPQRAARVSRFAILRRLLLLEAGLLVATAPVKTLASGVPLQWGWPATLSAAMLLITWGLERIVRAEWREHRRLVEREFPEN